jgi:histidinol-phosphate aminotransferase
VQVLSGENFAFPLEEVLSRIGERTRLIAVANPNNPTGVAVACHILLQVARAAPQAAVLVDEAYFEFHQETMLNHPARPSNLFVARTFSKAYGLAGLRLGILTGDSAQMAMVRRSASPYNVNAVALAVLPEALRDQEYVKNYVAEVQRGRGLLERELQLLALSTGRAGRTLCWCASGLPIRNSFKLCAHAESWYGTEIPIRDVKAACA